MSARLKHGAWTWVKLPLDDDREAWALSPECVAVLGSRWSLKNYGEGSDYLRRERSSFRGWRLVSGSPVGPQHADLKAAAEYARKFLNTSVLLRKQDLQAQIDAIDALLCS